MTTHVRRFAAVPARTSAQTWRAVLDVVDPPPEARKRLEAATNAAAISIAEEVTATDPIVLVGCGPQLRIYTVHGEDSPNGTHVNERPVPGLAFNTGWKLHIPPGDDADLLSSLVDGNQVVIGGPVVPETDGVPTGNRISRVDSFDLAALKQS